MNTRTSFFALAMVFGPGLLLGCQSAQPVQSPADQAAAVERTRCTGDLGDAAVAAVLNGSAVERVQPLYDGSSSKSSNPHFLGASIVVRPARGETAEWLDRALECHGAQQLATHASDSAAQADPFFLPNALVRINVTSAGDGFLVQLTGESSTDAREIWARAQALLGPRAGSPENATAASYVR
jgi:hypothetical protein